jgi:hypothetical protein
MFCLLAERFGWTFEHIGTLTLDQMEAALEYCRNHPPMRSF